MFTFKGVKERITVMLTEASEFGKNKRKRFEMLSWERPLWSCARKPILECLCSWEKSAQMRQQKLWCSYHSYKTLPWGSTTWVGVNGIKVHFNQWTHADTLWIRETWGSTGASKDGPGATLFQQNRRGALGFLWHLLQDWWLSLNKSMPHS